MEIFFLQGTKCLSPTRPNLPTKGIAADLPPRPILALPHLLPPRSQELLLKRERHLQQEHLPNNSGETIVIFSASIGKVRRYGSM